MARSKKAQNIPLHTQEFKGPPGFKIERIDEINMLAVDDKALLQAHRDDHYIFLLLESGGSQVMIDFVPVALTGPVLLFVMPGQVHHYIVTGNVSGWFMAMDASLMNDSVRQVLEEQTIVKQALQLKDTHGISQCMRLLYTQANRPGTGEYRLQVLHTLVTALLAMFAEAYNSCDKTAANNARSLRAQAITKDFKKLLAENFITVKNPGGYAGLLNITPSYLNEAVKQVTGFSVSYWIQQQILLEAKRLLYYTEMTVKEIAHAAGYEDHAYFARLFKKNVQCTPLGLRQHYRELSNHPR